MKITIEWRWKQRMNVHSKRLRPAWTSQVDNRSLSTWGSIRKGCESVWGTIGYYPTDKLEERSIRETKSTARRLEESPKMVMISRRATLSSLLNHQDVSKKNLKPEMYSDPKRRWKQSRTVFVKRISEEHSKDELLLCKWPNGAEANHELTSGRLGWSSHRSLVRDQIGRSERKKNIWWCELCAIFVLQHLQRTVGVVQYMVRFRLTHR